MPLKAEITHEGIRASVGAIPTAMRKNIRKAISVALISLVREVKTRTYPASGLHVRTGALRRSVVPGPIEEGKSFIRGQVLVGQNLPYAMIHEYGGEIRPKNASYLTIPLAAVKTPAGVARFRARDAEAYGYQTFVRNRVIFGSRDGRIVPLFALKSSVKIPARPFFRPAIKAKQHEIVQLLVKALRSTAEEVRRE
jgi:phage gpG-like protein